MKPQPTPPPPRPGAVIDELNQSGLCSTNYSDLKTHMSEDVKTASDNLKDMFDSWRDVFSPIK
jgi:hypothetical protein